MKKVIIGVIVILNLLLMTACGTQQVEEGLTVGLVLPLTGAGASVGESFLEGFQLGINETITIDVQDSKSSSKEGVNAAIELTNIKNVNVLVSLLSSVVVPMTSVAEEYAIPLIASSVSEDDFAKRSPYAFRIFPPARQEASMAAKFANTQKWKKMSIIHVATEFGVSMKDHFIEHYNGEVLTVENFNVEDTDFSTILWKASQKNPDAIYFVGFPLHQFNVVEERKKLGIEIPFLAPIAMSSSFVRENLGALYDNIYATTSASFVDNIAIQEFNEKYEERFGDKPDWPASFGHDTALVLNDLKESNNILEDLHSVKVKGLNGVISFDEDGETPIELVIVKAENGSHKILENAEG